MSNANMHQLHHPNHDVPDEFEPGTLPVEPDQGPVPEPDPNDPERHRIVDPPVSPAPRAQRTARQAAAGGRA